MKIYVRCAILVLALAIVLALRHTLPTSPEPVSSTTAALSSPESATDTDELSESYKNLINARYDAIEQEQRYITAEMDYLIDIGHEKALSEWEFQKKELPELFEKSRPPQRPTFNGFGTLYPNPTIEDINAMERRIERYKALIGRLEQDG